jgi:hypothetical protein
MLLGLSAVAFLAIAYGCGQKREGGAVSDVGTTPGPVALAERTVSQPTVPTEATTGSVTDPGTAQGGSVDAAAAESLPPEIDATVTEGLITPGTVIEISGGGLLGCDGDGPSGLARQDLPDDARRRDGGVAGVLPDPMKVTGDRLALSVTAKNGVNQWRRVWVFRRSGARKPPRIPAGAEDSGSRVKLTLEATPRGFFAAALRFCGRLHPSACRASR